MRYLFTEFCGIGDLIQITPIMKAVSDLDAQSEIYLIGDNRWGALEVVNNSKLISFCYNAIDTYNKNINRPSDIRETNRLYKNKKQSIKHTTKKWINGKEFDVVFQTLESDLPEAIEQAIRSSNVKCYVRHIDSSNKVNSNLWTRYRGRKVIPRFIEIPHKSGRHDIDSNFDLLDKYIEDSAPRSYKTWVDVREDNQILNKYGLIENKFICIQPGAANGQPTPKTWHPENFLALCKKLRKAYPDCKIVSVGDRGDFETTIRGYEWPANVVNTAGETNIRELCQIIRCAQCVITHDSGIMHIANALGANLIALYGPTNYKATQPLGKMSKVIFSKTDAFLAMSKTSRSEEDLAKEYPDHSAMAGIRVEVVLEIVCGILDR